MTTIVVLPETKEIFSDSRMTSVGNTTGVITYSGNYRKVFKSKNDKIIAAGAGDTKLVANFLINLGISLDNFNDDTFMSAACNSSADIVILNKYNSQLYLYQIKSNSKGNIVDTKVNYYSKLTRAILGSGSNHAARCYAKKKDPVLAIKIASMLDRYTDDNIQNVKL